MKDALKVLLFKQETTYGTDATPTNVANFLAATNVDINPMEMETDENATVSNTFGRDQMIVGAVWSTIAFDIVLGGGGSPLGTAPNWGPVMRACGFAQTVVASTSVTYSLISTAEESATCYYYDDGVLFKMLGIRGSVSWDWTSKKAPRLRFKGIGLNVPMTDASMVTPTLPTIPRPLAMNKANTTLTIGGYAARLSSLQIDQNNDVQYRNLTGREDVQIVDRNMSGKATIELPTVAEKDFLGASGICTLGTAQSLVITHGATAGNILTMTLGKTQLLKPKAKREQGLLMIECDLNFARNTGNDEMNLVCT